MTQVLDQGVDRFDRPRVDKFEARRGELADAALETLGELGFARTSLREIAQKTAFSHGVLHYYFRDKVELITYCVRRYKEHCVTRYDEIVAQATSGDELARLFADALVDTMLADTAMHRLWYDLRSQAMFEGELRPTVVDLDRQLEAMVWRVVARYAELCGVGPVVTSVTAYSVFDGLFENCLIRHLAGDGEAAERLRSQAVWLIGSLVRS
ncbi:DNA-binding transcriptional regulator, AcrR family [Pedococcus dokdonensis]|uniref:DNA-binding transcriptional regulator, AcrR family n=1 Tax=Pedococcus dokdonensis TaxID=443156 RepID=A0A1H0US59_9MICO|nr:TetR/AcrR family transcriptional regulator [Pedococcus dokdonensis]SDP68798.1 DNA-binding transcriptional regulator, AcrR family [Pedococcus dokdonensis]